MKFYAYSIPNESGIVTDWNECKMKIQGQKARYKKFPTRDLAQNWLDNNFTLVLPEGVYFDAGTGSGRTEAKVTNSKGESILDVDIVNLEGYTNNFGELKAFVLAAEVALEKGIKNIYGDSKLVIDFWSKGFYKKELPKETISLIKEAATLRERFEQNGGAIERISGDINPADLGYH